MLQSPNSSSPRGQKMDPGVNDVQKTGDGSPANFPAGLRVLVVDDDPICLKIVKKMLSNCLYEVTTCDRAETALGLLRDNRNMYDVVISDVYMPDMDGFKLLELIGLEMDLPVIMMSADDSKSVVMKGITHGACDYLIKPIHMEAVKNIWQHVVRRKKKDFEQSPSSGDQKQPEGLDYSSPNSGGLQENSKKRKDEQDESEDRDESPSSKKPRVVWSIELHQQFVTAVNQLGIDKAVPKKILELMNVPGLTRENVASHLQKYRMYLRKLSSESQQPISQPFGGPPDFSFGPMIPHNAVDLQALAAASYQLQATTLSRANSNQRDIFCQESPKLRFLVGNQQQQNNINELHGIPTNMHIHTQNNSLRVPMLQPQNFNEVNPSMVSQHFPSSSFSIGRNTGMSKPLVEAYGSQGHPVLPLAISGHPIFSLARSSKGLSLTPLEEVSRSHDQPDFQKVSPSSQPNLSQTVDYSVRARSLDFSGNARMSKPGEEVNGPQGYVHNYNAFHHLNQNRALSFEPSYVKGEQSRVLPVNRPNFSEEHCNMPNVCHIEQFGEDDLMSTLLKEQQESMGVGSIANELGSFDAYHIDNLPV